MLGEIDAETARLSSERTSLAAARDAELAAIRDKYAARLIEIDEQIKTADRLRNALEPKKREPKKPIGAPKPTWTPTEEVQLAVLRAISDGNKTILDVTNACGSSKPTVTVAINYLRSLNEVRMTGRVKELRGAPNGYALTPIGEDRLSDNLHVVDPLPFRDDKEQAA